MRVLVVTASFPSESAPGLGIFNLRDAEFLSKQHDVTVLHLVHPSAPEAAKLVEVVHSQSLRVSRCVYDVRDSRLRKQAARRVRTEAASHDLVHTMVVAALLPVGQARTGLPWVHTEHASALVNAPAPPRIRQLSTLVPRWVRCRLQGNWLRGELASPDVMIAVGARLAEGIAGYRRQPVRVIGNSVRFPNDPVLPEAPESRGENPLRLVAVGNLVEGKGPIELVEAVGALSRAGVEATLDWAGVGPLSARVIDRASALGIAENVHLLGHVAPEQLTNVLRQAHIFALPTASETYGIAIAEAMACGLPVVTSGVGEHTNFLAPEASRIVQSRDGDALAAAILELSEDERRWDAETIQRHARDSFSEERRRREYEAAYEVAMTGRGRSRSVR